ncbi:MULTISPECIES: hypothetical protein [unclassified Photobacterium]|uniref:hypothetical protein n=1 Tax=unclassified Photobacterium TaxID=2628852 RepID=UPI001B8AF3E6|nr:MULTISPECIES: hypothetical protein [unclassified Photobacterium]MDO6704855.1 hypothetical protein [Photobacterium sp. 1_MG-2023]QUJ67919.1 hypothetical protein KDD30_01795 [Photobacterium sp. GJ3]
MGQRTRLTAEDKQNLVNELKQLIAIRMGKAVCVTRQRDDESGLVVEFTVEGQRFAEVTI